MGTAIYRNVASRGNGAGASAKGGSRGGARIAGCPQPGVRL